MKHFETFRFSWRPLETSLGLPKPGLGITDFNPRVKPSAPGRGSAWEETLEDSVLVLVTPAAHGASLSASGQLPKCKGIAFEALRCLEAP